MSNLDLGEVRDRNLGLRRPKVHLNGASYGPEKIRYQTNLGFSRGFGIWCKATALYLIYYIWDGALYH